MKQRLSGRNTIVLWLALSITLGIFGVVGYYAAVVLPETVERQNAERALAECRNQVNAQRWDEAERTCNQAVLLAPNHLSTEAGQLLQIAHAGWLGYYYIRGEHLFNTGEPELAMEALDRVFERDPTYLAIVDLRRQAQLALTPTSTPTLRPRETPPTSTQAPTSPIVATATATPPPTVNATATAMAHATTVARAVQATLEAEAEATQQAIAIGATLTASVPTATQRPADTPRPTATATQRATNTPARVVVHSAPIRNLSLLATVRASSTLPSDQWGDYHAQLAIDGNPATSWVEAAADAGSGEWIQLDFPITVRVDHLRIIVGYDRTEATFNANNRVRTALIQFADGAQFRATFTDQRGLQTVTLPDSYARPKETTSVRVEIESVYPGSRYADTPIAEIEVWGIADPLPANQNLAGWATVDASSNLAPDRWGAYYPHLATDGSRATAWVEGGPGSGIGEWLRLTFPQAVVVHTLVLNVGYDSSDDIFYANNRIQQATFIFSDGTRMQAAFADRRGFQLVSLHDTLGRAVTTTSIQVVIDSVYQGSRYDDTCLSEIQVWGVPQ